MDAISFHVTIRKDNYPRLYESLCDIKQGRQRSEKMQLYAAEFVKILDRMAVEGASTIPQPQTPTTQTTTEPQADENPALAAGRLAFGDLEG